MNHRLTLKTAAAVGPLAAATGLGSALGYRNAPDEAKSEGAIRGGLVGGGTGLGAVFGAETGLRLGAKALPQTMSPPSKALVLLMSALAGGGAGGAAGYGLAQAGLGPASYAAGKKEAPPAEELSEEEETV